MIPWLNILIPLGVAILGALGSYLAAVRGLSGSIETSTAEDLWQESRSIRDDYRRRIGELIEQIERCQRRIDELDARNNELSKENGHLRDKLEEQNRVIAELREEIHRLTDDNIELRAENTRLKSSIKELEDHSGA